MSRYGGADLTGRRFHSLTVIGIDPKSKHGRPRWRCKCDCGKFTSPSRNALERGTTKGCGCLRKKLPGPTPAHGLTGSKVHLAWCGMLARCYRAKGRTRKNYQDRGIRVCKRWRESFLNFLADVGMPPSMVHSLERIKNDGDYKPSNVRWATGTEQARNKRTNRWISFGGKTLCLTDWAKRIGISAKALRQRLTRWPLKKSLQKKKSG